MALINVQLTPGAEITQMDDADLLKLEGQQENEGGILRWVQYHTKTNGDMVHRSVDIVLKQVAVEGLFNL